MSRRPAYATAATGTRPGEEGHRLPTGEVHAWSPGINSTVCGLQLSRSGLDRFPHVPFRDALPESGGSADYVAEVCPRCRAAVLGRAGQQGWQRTSPRP